MSLTRSVAVCKGPLSQQGAGYFEVEAHLRANSLANLAGSFGQCVLRQEVCQTVDGWIGGPDPDTQFADYSGNTGMLRLRLGIGVTHSSPSRAPKSSKNRALWDHHVSAPLRRPQGAARASVQFWVEPPMENAAQAIARQSVAGTAVLRSGLCRLRAPGCFTFLRSCRQGTSTSMERRARWTGNRTS